MRVFAFVSALFSLSFPAVAAPPPDLALTNVDGDYDQPIAIAAPKDGSNRLFVVERCVGNTTGKVRIVKNGTLLPTSFIELPVSCTSEQGMLGLAFAPDYAASGEFYIALTRPTNQPKLGASADQAIVRCTATPPSADIANPSCTTVIRIPDLADNHNGGDIHFGRDGYLYYSMGDGGIQGDPNGFAQCTKKKLADNNPASCGMIPGGNSNPVYYLLGKILRLDVKTRPAAAAANACASTAGQPAEYAIPSDNPFAADMASCAEIWHYGLRNPFRFSIDRASGDLLIGDVGSGHWEEIDSSAADPVTHVTSPGINYGWPRCEGGYNRDTNVLCNPVLGQPPVFDYPHPGGYPGGWIGPIGSIVIGGYTYRGPFAGLRGTYIFADLSNGSIYFSTRTGMRWPTLKFNAMSANGVGAYAFGEDADGNLYVADNNNGKVKKFASADRIFDDDFEEH